MIGSELKMGAIRFTIERVSRLLDADKDHAWGQTTFGVCKVGIEADNDEQQQRNTVWHEAFHIHFVHTGQKSSLVAGRAEEVIDMLSHGVLRILQDNQWLCPHKCCQKSEE